MWHFGIFFCKIILLQNDRRTLKQTYLEVNEIDMLPESCSSVELFSAEIADHRVFTVVVEHVSSQLCILDEFLPAYVAFVIPTAGVRSDMTIQSFLGSKAFVAHRTAVWSFARVHAPKSYGN